MCTVNIISRPPSLATYIESKNEVRSLTLQLEEGKKEARWMRERNQELERVVEALRKTIMRQADLSSQRVEQQGESSTYYLLCTGEFLPRKFGCFL